MGPELRRSQLVADSEVAAFLVATLRRSVGSRISARTEMRQPIRLTIAQSSIGSFVVFAAVNSAFRVLTFFMPATSAHGTEDDVVHTDWLCRASGC